MFFLRILMLPFLVVLLFIRCIIEYFVICFKIFLEQVELLGFDVLSTIYYSIGLLILPILYIILIICYIFHFIFKIIKLLFVYPFKGYVELQSIFNRGFPLLDVPIETYFEVFKDKEGNKSKNIKERKNKKIQEDIFYNNDNNAL